MPRKISSRCCWNHHPAAVWEDQDECLEQFVPEDIAL
jgi:hypothetical protein